MCACVSVPGSTRAGIKLEIIWGLVYFLREREYVDEPGWQRRVILFAMIEGAKGM